MRTIALTLALTVLYASAATAQSVPPPPRRAAPTYVPRAKPAPAPRPRPPVVLPPYSEDCPEGPIMCLFIPACC